MYLYKVQPITCFSLKYIKGNKRKQRIDEEMIEKDVLYICYTLSTQIHSIDIIEICMK